MENCWNKLENFLRVLQQSRSGALKDVTSLQKLHRTLLTSAFLALALGTGAGAEGLKFGGNTSKSRAALFRSQVSLLDGKLADQYSNVALNKGAERDVTRLR